MDWQSILLTNQARRCVIQLMTDYVTVDKSPPLPGKARACTTEED